jgi:phosphonate degradation associated HDIG domain protein
MTTLIEQIEILFAKHGQNVHDGAPDQSVSALSHALQCAQLAQWGNAEAPLVAAALLHDLGHFVERSEPAKPDAADDEPHEQRALALLSEGFGADVLEPIRLHVQAKRYLVASDPAYAATLAPMSASSLEKQGGPMSAEEMRAFERLPHAADAVRLRRWDEQAKVPGKRTPPIEYYLTVLDEVLQQPFEDSKTGIGPVSVV